MLCEKQDKYTASSNSTNIKITDFFYDDIFLKNLEVWVEGQEDLSSFSQTKCSICVSRLPHINSELGFKSGKGQIDYTELVS